MILKLNGSSLCPVSRSFEYKTAGCVANIISCYVSNNSVDRVEKFIGEENFGSVLTADSPFFKSLDKGYEVFIGCACLISGKSLGKESDYIFTVDNRIGSACSDVGDYSGNGVNDFRCGFSRGSRSFVYIFGSNDFVAVFADSSCFAGTLGCGEFFIYYPFGVCMNTAESVNEFKSKTEILIS